MFISLYKLLIFFCSKAFCGKWPLSLTRKITDLLYIAKINIRWRLFLIPPILPKCPENVLGPN